jgi:hypothetical protein
MPPDENRKAVYLSCQNLPDQFLIALRRWAGFGFGAVHFALPFEVSLLLSTHFPERFQVTSVEESAGRSGRRLALSS